MQYNFEWDAAKGKVNIRKHGISFQQAAEIFLDPLQLTIFDGDHSESEERRITLGKEKAGTLLVVIHTFDEYEDNVTIRIISSRKATIRERHQYEAGQ